MSGKEQSQAEEIKIDLAPTADGVVDEGEGSGEVELSAIEEEATSHGWMADGVDGKKNLTAEEFMDRQPIYDDIRQLKKSNKRLQDSVVAMKKMQEGIRNRERDKVIKELQAQKKEALENEDYDNVIKIDDAIAEERVAQVPETNEAFTNWVEDNDWYHQDSSMKQYADTIGVGYNQNNPNASMEEVYDYVTKEVKVRYPEKFGAKPTRRATSVESATRGRTSSKATRHSAADLPEQDRGIMQTLIRSGVMSEDDYLKEYFG